MTAIETESYNPIVAVGLSSRPLTLECMPNFRSGILVIDKPLGITSRSAIDRIAELMPRAKIGHAGTLDPMATGVLVSCIGQATRLVAYVQRMLKEYRTELRFGQRSATHDLELPLEDAGFEGTIGSDELERTLMRFRGEIQQVPPQFSAIRVGGRRAYDIARSGAAVELKPRPIRIDRLECLRLEYPTGELEIRCTGGTYVRSLVRDIGDTLGCGAVMTSLVRTAIGPFRLTDAVPVDQLDRNTISSRLLPIRAALDGLPSHQINASERAAVVHGRAFETKAGSVEFREPTEFVLVDESDEVLAIANYDPARAAFQPRIVLAGE